MEHRTVSGDEAAPRVLGNLFGGAGVVEDDLRKHVIRPAANPEIHVVLDLTGNDGGIRPLRGENKVDAKRPPLPRDGGQPVFNLRQQLLSLAVGSCLVQHLRHLVTGEYNPLNGLLCGFVVGVDVRAAQRLKRALAVFQIFHEPVEGITQIFLCEAHPAFLMPDLGEIHAAFEVGNADLRALVKGLQEQQLQQDALAAARRAAQQDMRNVREVDRHRAGIAFAQHQHKTLWGKIALLPEQHIRQLVCGRNSIDANGFPSCPPCKPGDDNMKCRFDGALLVLPLGKRDAAGVKLPNRQFRKLLVPCL